MKLQINSRVNITQKNRNIRNETPNPLKITVNRVVEHACCFLSVFLKISKTILIEKPKKKENQN